VVPVCSARNVPAPWLRINEVPSFPLDEAC